MANLFYGGVLLPEIPVIEGYPYTFIRKDETNGYYDLIYSIKKPCYDGTDIGYVTDGTIGTGDTRWYRIEIASASTATVWAFNKTIETWWVINAERTVMWSNVDMPVGSETSTDIYFYASEPTYYGIVDTAVYEVVSDTSIVGSVTADVGDIVLATITARSALTLPESLTLLNTSDAFSSSNQTLSFAYQKITVNGEYSYTIQQASAGRLYLNLIVLRGFADIGYTGKYYNISETEVTSTNPIAPASKDEGDMLIWGCSANLWLNTADYGKWVCTPNDLTIICLDSTTTAPRQANFIDMGKGAVNHTFYPNPDSTGSPCVVDAVELFTEIIVRKYLIADDSKLYTIVDGALSELATTDIVAQTFLDYGVDKIPSSALLIGMTNPKVMLWQEDASKKIPTLTATVTATPTHQTIMSQAIDLMHSSIKGISGMAVDCKGTPIFAVSFDNKATWMMHNGTDWVNVADELTGMTNTELEAITTEQWQPQYELSSNMYIRCTLTDATQSITSVDVSFIN